MNIEVKYSEAEFNELKQAVVAWKLLKQKHRLSFTTGIQNCLNENNNWQVINAIKQGVEKEYNSSVSVNQLVKAIELIFF